MQRCARCGTLKFENLGCPMCLSVPAVMALGLAGCETNLGCKDCVQPAYGVAETGNFDTGDADGDGYAAGDDCNDADDAIHPGAEDTPGDGVDSNCDGEDDT